jgi:hypothetical protein
MYFRDVRLLRQGLDWILGLLTTYTQDSELHVITALSLIYTLQFTITHIY